MAELPPHVTQPLLDRILEQSQDAEYAEAAARRAARDPSTTGGRAPRTRVVLALGACGLLLAVAIAQTQASAGTTRTGRAALVEGIEQRRDDLAREQERLDELLRTNPVAQRRLEQVTEAERAALARLRRVEARTGYLAVRGPGVRMTVDDGGEDEHRVRDDDLSLLVNALWAAGAEGIAIDGERVTSLSPLNSSGETIRLNNRSLTAPYTVLAIGDPRALQARFAETTHGLAWLELVQVLSFGWDIEDADRVVLPAGRIRPLRSAVVSEPDGSVSPGGGS